MNNGSQSTPDEAFLANFFNEDIYVIDEEGGKSKGPVREPSTQNKQVPDKQPDKPKRTSTTVILVEAPGATKINPKDKPFLQKILSSVNLNLNELTVHNLTNTQVSYAELLQQGHSKILAFGISAEYFPPQIQQHELHTIDGVELLLAPGLTAIAQDQQKKIFLWERLKKMFQQNQ